MLCRHVKRSNTFTFNLLRHYQQVVYLSATSFKTSPPSRYHHPYRMSGSYIHLDKSSWTHSMIDNNPVGLCLLYICKLSQGLIWCQRVIVSLISTYGTNNCTSEHISHVWNDGNQAFKKRRFQGWSCGNVNNCLYQIELHNSINAYHLLYIYYKYHVILISIYLIDKHIINLIMINNSLLHKYLEINQIRVKNKSKKV